MSLILCLVPMTRCETMLYWPRTSALMAYNGGTSVGHGSATPLFLEPDFVLSAGTLHVGRGPVRTLFLCLILSLVPMTPCDPTNWWRRRVLCALWTRRPSLTSLWGAVRNRQLYILRMYCKGCISFNFSICLIIYTTYRKSKITRPYRKKNSILFYNSHDLPHKKNTCIYCKKKITRLDDFFVHDLHFSPLHPSAVRLQRGRKGVVSRSVGSVT